jgi:hypothetical protein
MNSAWKVVSICFVLVLIALGTRYEGSTDIGDYADTSKYFASEYPAGIRNSHSYLYGFIHAPFVALFGSYLPLKLSGLVFLFLLIASVYWMSGKDARALWLLLLSPAVWYTGPWIGPLALVSLALLWSYWYLARFHQTGIRHFACISGLILGLGTGFWHTLLFFGFFLGLFYIYDKRVYDLCAFLGGIFLGLVPLFLLDWYLFGLPGYTLFKTLSGTLLIMAGGSIAPLSSEIVFPWLRRILVLLALPLSCWLLVRTQKQSGTWRAQAFLGCSLLIILANPQLRYTIVLAPLAVLFSYSLLSEKYYRTILFLSGALCLFVSIPYLAQINGSLHAHPTGVEITALLEQHTAFHYRQGWEEDMLMTSLARVVARYPNERFIVGPDPDSYQLLAHGAWHLPLTALISIQDYDAYASQKTILYQKTLASEPQIQERRLLTLKGTLEVNPALFADFAEIRYALGIDSPVVIPGFKPLAQEGRLYLSVKE